MTFFLFIYALKYFRPILMQSWSPGKIWMRLTFRGKTGTLWKLVGGIFFNWLHDCQKNILWLYQEFLEDEAIGQWRNLSDLNL